MKPIGLGLWLVCCTQFFACGVSGPLSTSVSTSSSPELANAQGKYERSEQTRFGAEEKIERPTIVPDDVLQILRKDEHNKRRLGKGQSLEEMTASWFTASEINLNDDELPDLIVQAVNHRLMGANLVPFWIFRRTSEGYTLLLKAGYPWLGTAENQNERLSEHIS